MLEWLPRNHPTRFVYDPATGVISTLTPGYVRDFIVAEYVTEPLRLCGMLTQEDMCVLRGICHKINDVY